MTFGIYRKCITFAPPITPLAGSRASILPGETTVKHETEVDILHISGSPHIA